VQDFYPRKSNCFFFFKMTSSVKCYYIYYREEFANLHGHRVNYRNTVKKLSTLQSKIEGWEVTRLANT